MGSIPFLLFLHKVGWKVLRKVAALIYLKDLGLVIPLLLELTYCTGALRGLKRGY